MSQDLASGSCPRDAQAAGAAHVAGAQAPVYRKQSGGSCSSLGRQGEDSGFGSRDGDAGEALGAANGSGTEHSELPQESETWPAKHETLVEIPEDALCPRAGSAPRGTELPQVADPAGHRQGGADSPLEQGDPCPGDGIAEEPPDSQSRSARRKKQQRNLGGFVGECRASAAASREGTVSAQERRAARRGAVSRALEEASSSAGPQQWPGPTAPAAPGPGQFSWCPVPVRPCPWLCPLSLPVSLQRLFPAPGEWIGSHPLLTLLVLIRLLFLVLPLGEALASLSGGRHGETPVSPVTPLVPDTVRLLACPDGWLGYRGVCYLLSRDRRTWDQGQARCSELGASLAVLKDEEMEFLFTFSRKDDYWLGLCRRGQGLQWVDGSSFNSSVPVLGNADCVYLADDKLRREICSTEMLYLCSRAQTAL